MNETNISFNNQPQEEEDYFEITERKRLLFFGLPWTFTTYKLTPKKLTVKTGFLTSSEDDILLFRVMDLSLTRTITQKMFNLATLTVLSSDKTLPTLEMKNIRNYKLFKDLLEESVEKERLRMRMRAGEVIDSDNGVIGENDFF